MTQHKKLRALALDCVSREIDFEDVSPNQGSTSFDKLVRAYIAAMNPQTTLALLDELDAARKALGVALGEKKALELSNHKLIDNSVDLHNEIDESTLHAKRYRYLRDRFYKDSGDLTICIPDAYDNFVGSSLSEGADAAIDAAIALIEGIGK